MGNKYSIHLVEMVRNNGNTQFVDKCQSYFFMFDYFDVLYYKELKDNDKQYLNYFAIGDTFNNNQNYKVSYKSLSLYQYHSKSSENPFLLNGKGKISETPFIGIIQISLCKENFEQESVVVIDKFLTKCEVCIGRIVDKCIEENMCGSLPRQLYRSSTTGDFCLVLRADSVEKIYSIALKLNETHYKRDGISILTYTNVGMECSIKGNEYCTLEESFVKKHSNMTFALRFSADDEFGKMAAQYEKEYRGTRNQDERFIGIKGLFGRYDYVWNISLEEFAQIYPTLCEKKIGINESQGKKSSEDISDLVKIIKFSCIRNINERILVSLNGFKDFYKDEVRDWSSDRNDIIEKNKLLFNRIERLDRWKKDFHEEHFAFQDLKRGTSETYKAFSPIGLERDAYINWLLFYRDMEVLCDNLDTWMGHIKECNEDESEKKELRYRLLKNWRLNLQAINQYTKLVQNVNYQTYQSPIYEMQTQIDTEKTLVAYREAMERYLQLYVKSNIGGDNSRDEIYPIFYPDLLRDIVAVETPFATEWNNGKVRREVVCTVPSFEYFGRLYDLLPWIMHECSHQIRILDREKRNYFIADYILGHAFKIAMEDIFRILADSNLYLTLGAEEQKIVNAMTKTAAEEIFKDIEVRNYDFHRVIQNIQKYLTNLFGSEREKLIGGMKETRLKEEAAFNSLLDICRKERLTGKEWVDELGKIRQCINVAGIIENIVISLLENYKMCICNTFKTLPDIVNEVSWVEIKDFLGEMTWLEIKVIDTAEKMLEMGIKKDVVQRYCFDVKQLYRIYEALAVDKGEPIEKQERLNDFLGKVYERILLAEKQKFYIVDSTIMHIWRNIGLLNEDKELFVNCIGDMFSRIDKKKIKNYCENDIKEYREACADLMMVTSLNIDSFGYCRQVLQTISDSKIASETYDREAINFKRFQIIIAVLLKSEGCECKKYRNNEIVINGKKLIEKGEIYCRYTLLCVKEQIFKRTLSVEEKKLVKSFLEIVYTQLKNTLGEMVEEAYRQTFLFLLLHGGLEGVSEKTRTKWEDYKTVINYFAEYKHIFWRLEGFCRGLNSILIEENVIVKTNILEHMEEILVIIRSSNGRGCSWECEMPNDLLNPKLDVGDFYNNPEKVHLKTKEEKLENTIEFIQNFYYSNRFRIIREKDDYIGRRQPNETI